MTIVLGSLLAMCPPLKMPQSPRTSFVPLLSHPYASQAQNERDLWRRRCGRRRPRDAPRTRAGCVVAAALQVHFRPSSCLTFEAFELYLDIFRRSLAFGRSSSCAFLMPCRPRLSRAARSTTLLRSRNPLLPVEASSVGRRAYSSSWRAGDGPIGRVEPLQQGRRLTRNALRRLRRRVCARIVWPG